MKRIIILFACMIVISTAGCIFTDEIKDVTITGFVYDKATAKPLSGVYVVTSSIEGDQLRTQTDANGYFCIKTKVNCEAGGMTLFINMADKKPVELKFYDPEANPCKIPPLVVYLEDRQ